jgi:hypothetical protein
VRIVIGVVTRTGSAVAVALSGPAAGPRFVARTELAMIRPGVPAQPYHAAADMSPDEAGRMIAEVESAAEQAATAGLRALADMLPGHEMSGVAVVVKAVSVPQNLADILRSHAWMHAAEGELYRRAVLAAAADGGWAAHAVDRSALPSAERTLAELGHAAGRPWRRIEKDAARAAITLL